MIKTRRSPKGLSTISILAITFFVCSCQTNEPIHSDSSKVPKIVDFKDQKVLAYDDQHAQFLSMTEEQFSQHYKSLHRNARIAEGSDQDYLTSEELTRIVKPFLADVPDLSWDKDISEADQQKIYRDIPTIKTPEDIRKNGYLIYQYYGFKKLKDVLAEIVVFKQQNGKSGRVNAVANIIGDITNQNPHEQSVLLQALPLIPMYTAATATAQVTFGGPDDKKKNAALHASWNAFAIRNIILAGIFEDPATTYVRKGTSAHEMTGSGEWIKNLKAAMDLNANMIGRNWMNEETGWGLFGIRKMPDEFNIRNTMIEKSTNNIYKATYLWHILDRYAPGNNEGAWNMLYTHNNGPNPFLMYLEEDNEEVL